MAEDVCYDDGSSLRTLYDNVHGGPGVGVVESSVTALRRLQRWAAGSAERVRRAVHAAGAEWQGQAAEASTAAMRRVGQWAEQGGAAAGSGGARVQDYASSFAEMKPKIAPPRPVPPPTLWDDMFPAKHFGLTDHAAAVAHNAAATRAAFAAYTAHDANTRTAVEAFPAPAPVPAPIDPAGTGPPGAGPPAPGRSGPGGESTTPAVDQRPTDPSGAPASTVPSTWTPLPPRAGADESGQALTPRGLGPAERPAPGMPGEPVAGGTGARPGSGPGGAPVAGGGQRPEREHRNDVFLPSDEPFTAGIDEDAVPPVLGPDQEHW